MAKKTKSIKDPTFVNACIAESAPVHPALKDFFGYCFYKAALRMRAAHLAKIQRIGLIPPHSGILNVLHISGPLSQIAMGNEMGIDKATMVKLIDTLEKKKLVQRKADTKDRRIKFITITPKGVELLKELKTIRAEVEREFFSPLTEDEANHLRKIVPKLLK